MTLFGIWYVADDGKLTLCESDESMSIYYDCAFTDESRAMAYAAKETEMNRFGSRYVARPLPSGCVAQWVDGTESELSDLESASHPDKEAICATINSLTPYRACVNENGVPVIFCGISEIGDLFASLSRFPQTNWVEYSVQFDF
jgi:hypothetical protein